ncbi:hypothetical protein KC19_1G189200 [Ceratodon purpureus]|uniref:ABC-type xenobiotic transporter n=1 Tax=Ceratodon purpureus TaxID=3225 RepID=A0A8T0J9P0_CERPU|nr:hypothetical protein KC19_1G189200 [Ceratodon purpureus]
MEADLITRFCRPLEDGVWSRLPSGFGAYTPCLVDTIIVNLSCIVLLFFTIQRIRSLVYGVSIERFKVGNPWRYGPGLLLASFCAVAPLAQIALGVSTVNLDGESSMPPFEITTLILLSFTWMAVLALHVCELRSYTKTFVWYVRFAILYLVVAQTTMVQFTLSLRSYYSQTALHVAISQYVAAALLGVFYLLNFPTLVPQAEYSPIGVGDAHMDGVPYEPLAGEREVCPERKSSVFTFLLFGWMSPLMKLGYQRPLTDKDIWLLDSWDTTETLYSNFEKAWDEERVKPSPWLLRSLNKALGARFWLGGVFKIGNDAAQFVGPIFLSKLLESMQNREPVWHGYVYAASIFFGVLLGVICEGQYFQNVMRVGMRTRSTLIAAVFRKSLRLTQAGRKGFTAGKITNLMTTDAEALQQISQQLHSLWSSPLRIVIAITLLYQQLGVASIFGSLVLLVMIPLQTFMVTRMRNLSKEGLQRTDRRIGLMNEILSAMDIVKCYAWENSFRTKVLNIRDDEISWFRKAQLLSAVNTFCLNSVPILVTVLAFGFFTYFGGILTPAKAFTSLSLFAVLRFPLFMFPTLVTAAVNANVSLKRLQDLLLAEERVLALNPPLETGLPAISVKDGSFAWDASNEDSTLSKINFEVEVGSLVAIVGSTGEGKTSLLSAVLGEMATRSGNFIIRGKVAYVPQVSWIFNATVRDNILFGLPYNADKYNRAIRVAGLERDLSLLPGGDLTEIGERGVNISGGQKQRVSIARAVYADADVYLFDDPLSALDAHVAKQVFDTCLKDELRNKTRVLVTNQLHFLSRVDKIILIHRGEIKEQGSYDDLMANGPLFNQLMEKAGSIEDSVDDEEGDAEISEAVNGGSNSAESKAQEGPALKRRSSSKKNPKESEKEKEKRAGASLIKTEERETGIISWKVLARYRTAMGGALVVGVLFLCYIVTEVIRLSTSGWLSIWTDNTSPKTHGPMFYLEVYSGLSFAQVCITLGNSFWLVLSSLSAAQSLHNGMLGSILRAPMSFFHANPVGRIINRFAKDTGDIDRSVAMFTNMFLTSWFSLMSTFFLIGYVNTISLWAILPLLLAFYSSYLYFQATAREVKRMDSITRSPVYAQFGEALNGLATIRAYKAYDRMANMNGHAMDTNARFTVVTMSSNRWLGVRLEFLGGLMIWMTGTLAVFGNSRARDRAVFAPQMGLLLSYALNITNLMTAVLRLASLAENSFNAVERVGNYVDIEQEAPLIIEDHRPPPGWPSAGKVEFKNVVMRYRPNLPAVLQGVSVEIRPMEKVGVVGRTGAGKSSLFNTLFRVVEPESGQILIDGIDIRTLGLADLRKNLGIIPQTPVLFSGTIRFNLDPFSEHSDADLWESLERAHLKDVVRRNTLGLEAEVSEGGENFSVGQRQLLSLARALLRRSKILVLDEATAAVDVGTDALIQKTIREEFKSCTMLIIAHRLNTIIDSDRILVLDAGRIVEMDTPQVLVMKEDSMFAGMVRSTGPANARYLQRIAMGDVDRNAEIERDAAAQKVKWEATSRWARAAQWALGVSLTSSQQDLTSVCEDDGEKTILEFTRDATMTLHQVLTGQHDSSIREALIQRQGTEERWWSALSRVLEGFAVMGRHSRDRIPRDQDREPFDWSEVSLTGSPVL